ncbi:MAG: L-aspartate oxidase [Patescibacteria group bacterium]|nr:L-aspartate oxidase [Patescibacteria group bacterium]
MNPDFIIIGSGIAGLNLALSAAKKGKVLIITKKRAVESNTNRAQGGIAAVLAKTDDFKKHVKDTMTAGSYHNNKKAVEYMVERGPKVIQNLIDLGLEFTTSGGVIDLGQEGGHSHRRIAHVGDFTGQEIEKILVQKVKENSKITVWENTFALELIVKNKICNGVQIIKKGKIENIYASAVIIATGSIGQLYRYTTNSKISTGDGIAMAMRAGCKTKDLEFIQFHPTVLDKNINPKFLLSEALRGEGAVLRNSKGEIFMKSIHPQAGLAPRDIVSRAIWKELEKGPVYLDITGENSEMVRTRFPNIYKTLLKYKYDLTKDRVPISPAVHYSCGGIKVDLHGQTCIKNLFATGEVTHTGVHGANRLASNSLLEALVFSEEITDKLKKRKGKSEAFAKPSITEEKGAQIRKRIRELMWKYAGVIRTKKGLVKLQKELGKLEKLFPSSSKTNITLAETKNMLTVAKKITSSALKRDKSLGCHFITN